MKNSTKWYAVSSFGIILAFVSVALSWELVGIFVGGTWYGGCITKGIMEGRIEENIEGEELVII